VELLIFIIAVCVVAFLAKRFGYDSRDSAWSTEAELGAHGVTWEPDGALPLDFDSPESRDVQGTDFFRASAACVRGPRAGTGGKRPRVNELTAMFSRCGGFK
jgi:hypothetical protein